MRSHEVEAWVLQVIQRVVTHQPVEDARVELKREWPVEPRETARRLAGHANAARAQEILWLIGVDERAGAVPGAALEDVAAWWPAVESRFDQLAPAIYSLAIPYEDRTVVALHFEVDRVPYVVKSTRENDDRLEVPFRVGTGTRSARRSDLLPLLATSVEQPEVEVLAARVVLMRLGGEPPTHRWSAWLEMYISMSPEDTIVMPDHRTTAWLRSPEGDELAVFHDAQAVEVDRFWHSSSADTRVHTVARGVRQMILKGRDTAP